VRLLHRSGRNRDWECCRVPAGGATLRLSDGGSIEITAGREPDAAAHVVPFAEGSRESAALVVAPDTRAIFVDGRSPLGVSVLEERSEVVIGDTRLYLTTREPLLVAPHAGDTADCALCGDSVAGDHVIACSNCGAVTHEGPRADGGERFCFTHRGCCPGCRLRREDFAWTPPEDE